MSLEPAPEAPNFFLVSDLRSWAVERMCKIASVPPEKATTAMFSAGQQSILADLLDLIEQLDAK